MGWRSFLTALAAFGAAMCRVASLLVTRAALRGTDARVTPWYSLAPAAVVFVAAILLCGTVHLPLTDAGWAAFFGMCITTMVSTLWIFVSVARIGAFGTALAINLEPVLTEVAGLVCGARTKGAVPETVSAPVQYEERIAAVVV